jgi:hypothetical protein
LQAAPVATSAKANSPTESKNKDDDATDNQGEASQRDTKGALPAPNNDEPKWTPGIVRLMAMKATIEVWADIHPFVECAGDTPEEKLATFEKEMVRHGITGVRILPLFVSFLPYFISPLLSDSPG